MAASVLWDPGHCSDVLRVLAATPGTTANAFYLPDLPLRWKLVADRSHQHLLLHDAGRSLQLCSSGTSLLHPARLLTDVLADRKALPQRIEGLHRLNHINRTGRIDSKLFPPDPRGARYSYVLQALDGRLAGFSDRTIAVKLFGEDRVRADWNDAGDHLRDRVRRAVSRGLDLMRGGYLRLLQ